MLERGLLTERSPGGRETALSSKVAADTGLFIGRRRRAPAWPSALKMDLLCSPRGLLTERSPGSRETALSSKVAADTGVFIGGRRRARHGHLL